MHIYTYNELDFSDHIFKINYSFIVINVLRIYTGQNFEYSF